MAGRRWEAVTGAMGLGLLFVGLFLPGPPPKADDSIATLTRTIVDHRAELVRGTVLAGLALMLLLWFVAVLADAVRGSDATNGSRAGAVLLGGGAAVLSMFLGMLLFSGVAFKAAGMGDAALVRAVVDTGNMVIEAGKYGFAVLILATCSARGTEEFLTPRARRAGYAAALILVLSTVPPFFADRGIGQFGGGIDVLGGIPAFAWLIVLSAVMTRSNVAADDDAAAARLQPAP